MSLRRPAVQLRRLSRLYVPVLLYAAKALAQEVSLTDSAEGLFTSGRFAEAERAFLSRWASDSSDYRAALRLGTIGLLANRLDDAERWLSRAIALRPDSVEPKALPPWPTPPAGRSSRAWPTKGRPRSGSWPGPSGCRGRRSRSTFGCWSGRGWSSAPRKAG